MPRLTRFVLVLTAIVGGLYAYVSGRLADSPGLRLVLFVPFLMVWLVPVVYWGGERDTVHPADDWLHAASYLCMGWLNFLVLLTLLRDALLVAARVLDAPAMLSFWRDEGRWVVLAGSVLALVAGVLFAFRGPHLRQVRIAIEGLQPALEGLRIVQISDLHVGPTIGERYVRRVVEMANAAAADLVVLTGDIVDGPPARLARHVAPLGRLAAREQVLFVLGNHDCYSGARRWIAHFQGLGMRVLLNEYVTLERGGARIVFGGVVDPALQAFEPGQVPRPDLAAAPQAGPALRILLAHNPAIAVRAQAAGFDLQLSGHTHAGQFFPWTLAVRLVHGPHVAGLSRQGPMWVYVSAGTGTWGPPVRFGSEPELTVLTLVASRQAEAPAVLAARRRTA
ncbi:metallophosphoesterase [Ramlibacter tataouinensis]|uniref:metallophosphoesterase n=1 Tax=Ramlibacter tataouinensis TaxID=94132 RepID=UPI0022F38029|nr:metallophosphoesterase [Ramlibacter tataouinensis]WBY01662.1 metallophosphoesterase [Ramlibacter tataouinensis]